MYSSIDVILGVAKKLQNPTSTQIKIAERITGRDPLVQHWTKLSLASGLSGIACFYQLLHKQYPDENWDKTIRNFLAFNDISLLPVEINDVSLYYGLAGLAFAIYACSDNRTKYQTSLKRIDQYIIEKTHYHYLNKIDQYLDETTLIPPSFYNLAEGLSGIIVYTLQRENSPELTLLRKQCVEAIVKLLTCKKRHGSTQIQPWYTREQKREGYKLDIPNGIPGVLSVLSQLPLEESSDVEVTNLIQILTQWIIKQKSTIDKTIHWGAWSPNSSSYESLWKNGAPGILRCLYFAGKALNDQKILSFIEKTYVDQFCIESHQLPRDPTFFSGKAGLLLIGHRMALDTQNYQMAQSLKDLEFKLIHNYNPDHLFGFQSTDFSSNQIKSIDHPGLFSGACGAAASLLMYRSNQQTMLPQIWAI